KNLLNTVSFQKIFVQNQMSTIINDNNNNNNNNNNHNDNHNDANEKHKFKTLVIFDVETTGLVPEQPKITELAMVAVDISALESTNEELPRVMNKFIKVFNPEKLLNPIAAKVSGISNLMLLDYPKFSLRTLNAIDEFLGDLQQPMCLIAHNGDNFDFPVLSNQIRTLFNEDTQQFAQPHSSSLPSTAPINPADSSTAVSTCASSSSLSSSTDVSCSIPTCSIPSNVQQHPSLSSLLFSTACADSIKFFRYIHRLMNDKDLLQTNDSSSILLDGSSSPKSRCLIEETNSDFSKGSITPPNTPQKILAAVQNSTSSCEKITECETAELCTIPSSESDVAIASVETSRQTMEPETTEKKPLNVEKRLKVIDLDEKPRYVPSNYVKRTSFSLSEIYLREFNRHTPYSSHRAEDDCLTLLACLKRYLPDVLEWIESNHRPLNQFIMPMFTFSSSSTNTQNHEPVNNQNVQRVKRPLRF
ncbi:unnamed protein product, partial [Didymodactylos carnosus]